MVVAMSASVGFLVFLVTHVTLWHQQPSNDPRMRRLSLLALGGLSITAAAHRMFAGADLVGLCAALWIATALMVGYFFVYAGVARSVSLTLLDRLRRASGERVAFEALLEEYQRSSRFDDRIRVMQRWGWMQVAGGAVSVTPGGAAVVRGLEALRRLAYTELRG